MGFSYKEMETIQEQFIKEYWPEYPAEPHASLINSVGISTLSTLKELERDVRLRPGESLEDFCLDVTLRAQPSLEFPARYKEVQVFYAVIGELVRFQGK